MGWTKWGRVCRFPESLPRPNRAGPAVRREARRQGSAIPAARPRPRDVQPDLHRPHGLSNARHRTDALTCTLLSVRFPGPFPFPDFSVAAGPIRGLRHAHDNPALVVHDALFLQLAVQLLQGPFSRTAYVLFQRLEE